MTHPLNQSVPGDRAAPAAPVLPWPHWRSDDGQVLLINADCLEVLPTLEGIDACICDPPYGIEHQTNHGASWARTQIVGDTDTGTRDAIIRWCGGRPWACFGSWKVHSPQSARGVLVWDKGPAFGMGDLSFPWKPSWEEIAIGGNGWTGYRDEGVIRGHLVVSWESKGRVHPHQKPVGLVEALLSKLPNAMAICDPTMGSGTSGVAAVQLGRRFIGIEIDTYWFERARDRIRDAHYRHTAGHGFTDTPELPLWGKP